MRSVPLVDALAGAGAVTGGQVVLVSSGAIAAGIGPLGLERRPRTSRRSRPRRASGRGAGRGLPGGVLGARAHGGAGAAHRRGRDPAGALPNAHRTLERLLELGVVPVVNENDTVATEEIRFGDNDRLAALVADIVGADALVLLTDVDALYDGRRRGGLAARAVVATTADLAP